MKMRSFLLDAGSIIAWKKYPVLTKIWSKIRRKALPYNKFAITNTRTEFLTGGYIGDDILIVEPIRKYSKQECFKLQALTAGNLYSDDWIETTSIINLIRPNTFAGLTNLEECRYYKKVKWNEKLDEYIY